MRECVSRRRVSAHCRSLDQIEETRRRRATRRSETFNREHTARGRQRASRAYTLRNLRLDRVLAIATNHMRPNHDERERYGFTDLYISVKKRQHELLRA